MKGLVIIELMKYNGGLNYKKQVGYQGWLLWIVTKASFGESIC
jgi:hypothetical protein